MELSLQDLATAAQLIDVAMQRGAFRANEASTVGDTFGKLTKFLEASEKAAQEANDAEMADELETQPKGELVTETSA